MVPPRVHSICLLKEDRGTLNDFVFEKGAVGQVILKTSERLEVLVNALETKFWLMILLLGPIL